jgi:hypothetical protein
MIDDETPYEIESDEISSLEDVADDKSEEPEVHSVAAYVLERFNRAETKKFVDEQRFLKSYLNYRGIYGKDVQFTDTEKSRVFIKVTKTKVLGAYAQLISVLFGNQRFPLSVEPSRLPEGVTEAVYMSPQEGLADAMNGSGQAPDDALFGTRDGPPLPPGATQRTLEQRLGPLKNKLAPVQDKLIKGTGPSPEDITFHPAIVAAKKMEKKIHDQLDESAASKHLRSTAFEMALFGTGIMKGPFVVEKEYPSWNEEGEYDPTIKVVPQTQHVSIWNFYPDPDAANMDEAEWIVERHKMSRQQLKALKKRPHFRSNAIDMACEYGENYIRKYWEQDMEDESSHPDVERFEVLEYWGYMDVEMLEEQGFDIPDGFEDYDQINVNIWVCNGQVLRLVMNPFKPSRIPYYAVPYEMNPYSFFGVGVAENMDDTQTLMNGFMRMAVDNAVLSGNLVFEVDENNLTPGQDLKIYPGKVFRRQGGAPGQAIFGTKFPNVTVETMSLFDRARELADESTGFPSFAHGQTNIQNVGRTASGISMLMDAAQSSIRTVVKNIDDYLLGPLGKAFFAFNMQFDFDPEIKGDLEVIARGTESLMANEIRSQRLMQFLGVVSNPVLAPFAKMDVIVREIAKSLDLDPDKVVNNMADAALQAEILKQFQGEQGMPAGGSQMPPDAQGGMPGMPTPQQAGTDAMDPTGAGGGTIGTGMVPTPGMQGFSAPGQGPM